MLSIYAYLHILQRPMVDGWSVTDIWTETETLLLTDV